MNYNDWMLGYYMGGAIFFFCAALACIAYILRGPDRR